MIYLTDTLSNSGYLVFDDSRKDSCLGVIKIKKGIILYVAPLVEDLLTKVHATVYDLITIGNYKRCGAPNKTLVLA